MDLKNLRRQAVPRQARQGPVGIGWKFQKQSAGGQVIQVCAEQPFRKPEVRRRSGEAVFQ
ncbi:MAG TPA: hypothetical protein DCO82_04870 [Alphaproteobacteria bacterium]|nr:hypothetical protein [Alphaproteobacteria bacterium]